MAVATGEATGIPLMSVVIQTMIKPKAAGVVFSVSVIIAALEPSGPIEPWSLMHLCVYTHTQIPD